MKDILAVGNAICDIIFQTDEETLQKFDLPKGSMVLCDQEKSSSILEYLKEKNSNFVISSGGSAANTITYLSKYGMPSAFIGNVADGYYGQKYYSEMQNLGVKFTNTHKKNEENTAKCIILVTPDGERTMCTYLGCASDIFIEEDILRELDKVGFTYVEGYLWDKPQTKTALSKIMHETRENGGKVAFTLSDSFCVQRHLEDFREIAADKIDVLFGNESEIMELYEISSVEGTDLSLLQNTIEVSELSVIVITRNDKGCVVVTRNEIITVDTKPVKAVDSTGAGDAFAAGFIYGLQKNLSYKDAAQIANNVAAQVVKHIGARPDINLPKDVTEIKEVA